MAIDGLTPESVSGNCFAGGGYAFFRFPHSTAFTYVAQRDVPQELETFSRLGQDSGVVVAPFSQTARTPLLLIRPDVLIERELPGEVENTALQATDDAPSCRDAYSGGFKECLSRLQTSDLRKVVYSRRLTLSYTERGANPVSLFYNACRLQPHCYVSLWWTAHSGCWLVATPEVLLAADESVTDLWHTMALAGTMPYAGHLPPQEAWSAKNREEQAYVSAYIKRQLAGLVSEEVHESPCYTVRAGNVIHLRTDFSFRLKGGVALGALLGRLHPTPAVCGDPLLSARSAIRAAESTPRRYYAGFSGPMGIAGHTALYVSLRCMELFPEKAVLYAGGGLLSVSSEDDEWDETCRKLQPMLQLFRRG